MAAAFLDTNVILRHVLADHSDHSPRATAFLLRLESGEFEVQTADTVVFEAVFTLERFYKRPRIEIREAILPLIELPGIVLPGKRRYRDVFDLYVDYNVSFADAHHAVLARTLTHGGHIVSFDRGFDRIPGVTRIEP